MAGPLGVSHLLLLSRSDAGNVNFRVALAPRGPTLHFRVDKYSLCKDISKAQRRPQGGGREYQTAPLLVMNNMKRLQNGASDPVQKQLEDLTTTIFQNMFPQISPHSTPLSTIRRIMLLNRDVSSAADGTFVLRLRHYAITTKRIGISRKIRKLDPRENGHREKRGGGLPNLGRLEDVSQYLLEPDALGFTSASETEIETDAEVEVLEAQTRRVLSKREAQKMRQGTLKSKDRSEKGNKVEKRAVKLVELGPRMKLRLVKVEEGVCDGKVMWNEFVKKSRAEEKELDQKWDQKRKEKERRRSEQRANVEKKKLLNSNTKANRKSDEVEDESMAEEWDSELESDDWDQEMEQE
jgi:ribosome biogenesis protein SSF1/2